MNKYSLSQEALVIAIVLLTGCSKQEEPVATTKFDAPAIAAEADKGNLGPLKDLNAACSAEVEKTGKRASACTTQEEVGALRKPLKLNF